jgi:hypothetical protein
VNGETKMHLVHGLDELEAPGQMAWIEAQHGSTAAPGDVVDALSRDGFEECDEPAALERDPYTDDGGES